MNAFTVKSSDLSRHDNWSPAFHRVLKTGSEDAFWRWMQDLKVDRPTVQRALLQAKDSDGAVKNVMRLILKRNSRAGQVSLEELQQIEALVRRLAETAHAKELSRVNYHQKRAGHINKLLTPTAESVVRDLLCPEE